jgi:hypothetical protein
MYMKKLLASVVVAGSTYAVYLEGEQSGNAILISTEFDNTEASVSRGALSLTLSESETPVGTTRSLITLNLSADGDLFPIDGEGAYLGIGTLGDVIDLTTAVILTDARITLRDLLGNVVFASDNLANLAVNNPPWDGSFPSSTTTILISEIGGQNISSITFDFYVSDAAGEVPEPGSVLLCGIGLLAVVAVRRRRRFQA